MKIKINQKKLSGNIPPLENLPHAPQSIEIPLDEKTNRGRLMPVVQMGQVVVAGQAIAEGEHVHLHVPISGSVTEITAGKIKISRAQGLQEEKKTDNYKDSPFLQKDFPRFTASIGLVGMGGGMFPSSVKIAASPGVSTLVINCVECEPGVTIDECLLLENADLIKAGANAVSRAVGAGRIVIALKKSAKSMLKRLRRLYSYDFIFMPSRYPAGAERLILKKLTGKLPSSGILPPRLGYLVHNTASVWAIGKAIRQGTPVIERPLTFNIPKKNIQKNIIVPVGMRIGELIEMYGHRYDKDHELIAAGGLMMGKVVGPDFGIEKGTNSVFVVSRKIAEKEEECILCGGCFDACPLGLHPALMVKKIKEKEPMTKELKAQLEECFLCGVCAASCRARIQILKYLKEGKELIKSQK